MTTQQAFRPTAIRDESHFFTYLLQIDKTLQAARLGILNLCNHYLEVKPWAKIRHTKKGDAYIMHNGRRVRLDKFSWL